MNGENQEIDLGGTDAMSNLTLSGGGIKTILSELIILGDSGGLLQTPIVSGRLNLFVFILPVAPSEINANIMIDRMKKILIEDNFIVFISFLTFLEIFSWPPEKQT